MDGKAVHNAHKMRDAVIDFIELVAKAILSGIGAGVAMGVAILLLSAGAQASPLDEARAGTLLLRSGGELLPAPAVSTEVAVEVSGVIARTRVGQVFHNPGTDAVEGVYVFPLPEKAAVDRLWMRVGEQLVEGRVQEKASALATYERARAEGRKAALVEQQRPNLFTSRVAHIGAGERIEIRIEYQQALDYDDGEYRLRFPLAAKPRYVPMAAIADPMPDVPKAAEAHGEPPLLQPALLRRTSGLLNPVDIVVALDAGAPLAEVRSSYHDTVIEKHAGERTFVQLAMEQEEADRDFELTWRIAPGITPHAAMFAHRGSETDYALIMVTPPRPDAADVAAVRRLPREMLLVIDTSGSMQGASIAQARLALEHALARLRPEDRFNVVEFNSVTRPLFAGALPATPGNVRHALQWVRALRADGGTEMGPALAFALDGRDTPGYLRQVVFVTDGAVGNEEALFRMIAERLGGSRLFTVGIGAAPNGHFMRRAALFGRGTFTHIGHAREVGEKMSRLFERIEAPVLRDVAIRWPDGNDVETFPSRVPDLYLGEPVLVAAAARAPLGTVVVSGTLGNQPWSVALTPPMHDASGVGALWARSKIASLMDELVRGADVAEIRPKIVKVALEHQLVSPYTSLVAVDPSPGANAPALRSALVAASAPADAVMRLPQTDTPALLQLLVGMLALFAAGISALLLRRR